MKEQKYKVLRFSFTGRRRVVRRNLGLAEAQAICSSPESSSSTAKGVPKTANPWFYGYEKQSS